MKKQILLGKIAGDETSNQGGVSKMEYCANGKRQEIRVAGMASDEGSVYGRLIADAYTYKGKKVQPAGHRVRL